MKDIGIHIGERKEREKSRSHALYFFRLDILIVALF